MYRVHVQNKGGRLLPLVYVRDACQAGGADEWAALLTTQGSLRGVALDAVYVGEVR